MDKQKQIAEMAKTYCQNGFYCGTTCQTSGCRVYEVCMELYNAGYRKIPENAVVQTKEQFDSFLEDYNQDLRRQIKLARKLERKETADKFAKKVSQAIVDNTYPYFDKDGKPVNIWNAVDGYDRIDEIAKEITEVVNET